jgi:hypothetical protein
LHRHFRRPCTHVAINLLGFRKAQGASWLRHCPSVHAPP